MNPIETPTTNNSLPKRILPCVDGSNGGGAFSQISNNSIIDIRDQKMFTPAFNGDKSIIKQVIGVGPSNNFSHSILKKSSTIQVPAATTFITSTSNSIVKTIVRPKPDAVVKSQQQQHQQSLAWSNECKSQQQQIVTSTLTSGGQQSLIKVSTSITQPDLSDKPQTFNATIKRPLPMLQQKSFPILTNSLAMQSSSSSSQMIYKTINGNSASSNCNEIVAPSLLSRTMADKLISRCPSTIRDLQLLTVENQLTKRRQSVRDFQIIPIDNKPMAIVRTSQKSSETPSTVEVTQISSTVTLTKTPTPCNQTKTLPSPLVTIEKKGSTVNLVSPQKQGKSVFGNGADYGMLFNESTGETGQKSLLMKQPSPTNMITTPPKQPLAQTIKSRQQSLLKVNSLARLLHTSPRTKRSKSMNAVGHPIKKRVRKPRKGRRLSTASDGELLQKAVEQLCLDPEAVMKEKKELSDPTVAPIISQSTSSLLCNDKIEKIPSSSSNNSSLEISPKKEIEVSPKIVDRTYFNSGHMNMVLGMLSTFNMLTWKERVGICKQSEMKFQINELNLVQIAEKCRLRDQFQIAYEKPIFERESSTKSSNNSGALYCCRRCECHGAAVDFLAPDFCSYDCFRRESRKRSKVTFDTRKNAVRERFKKMKVTPISEVVAPEIRVKQLIPKRFFTWASYLSASNAQPAPIDLFPNPFPCEANLFEIGMKLEAIDPEQNSLFCVCTVVEKKGYRLKLKFDGYSTIHNFWVNADSMDIFPPGWCAKTNRVLQPPKGINLLSFNWPSYLKGCKSLAAPRSLFTHLNSSSTGNPFKIGLRLEAVDLKNTGKVCVATVADVLDNRILVHFDGWDESYDYWIDINSPFIHPIGWHEQNGLELVPPPDWEEYFDWPEYLEFMRSEAAWPTMFSQRDPIEFTPGMKLEVVDFKNPCLIRPATVLCSKDYKVLVHLDGWPRGLTYWVNDDSPDIHPIKWASETGHDLEPPPDFEQLRPLMPCPVNGCRGIGHATRIDIHFHANTDTCPYEEKNWNIELERPSRVDEVERFVFEDKYSIKHETEVTSSDLTEDVKQQSIKKSPPQVQKQVQSNSVSDKKTTNKTEKTHQQESVLIEEKEIKIAREYLCDYGPRLRQNYKIWQENSTFNSNAIKKNPLEWSTAETAQYITSKCHPIGQLFKQQDIDGTALLSMHQSDLTDILKLKLGPSIKIYSHILHLRNQVVTRFMINNKSSTDT